MIVVQVKEEENIERALRRYKRKFDRTGRMRELRRRQAFVSDSESNRKMLEKARYVQKLREESEF
ncbi:ribosomal protein S21 [Bacteroidales bacterium KA00251]|nr:ribosomal protein S21 [Bacteroidales bacterium KA00251]